MKDITGQRELSYAELETEIEEQMDCISANDEEMHNIDQVMKVKDEIIALQDEMITKLCKQVLEGPSARFKYARPAYTDEDKLQLLKNKLSELKR